MNVCDRAIRLDSNFSMIVSRVILFINGPNYISALIFSMDTHNLRHATVQLNEKLHLSRGNQNAAIQY